MGDVTSFGDVLQTACVGLNPNRNGQKGRVTCLKLKTNM